MDNLIILAFYLGVGLIVSAVALWRNWLSLSDRAHVITMLYVTLFTTMLWGVFIALFVIVMIGDHLGAKLGNRRPVKQINLWWEGQFDE